MKDMEDKWLKDIQEQMNGLEVDEPQGLWDDICQAEQAGKAPRGSRLGVWGRRVAVVAILSGCIIGLGRILVASSDEPSNKVLLSLAHDQVLNPAPPSCRHEIPGEVTAVAVKAYVQGVMRSVGDVPEEQTATDETATPVTDLDNGMDIETAEKTTQLPDALSQNGTYYAYADNRPYGSAKRRDADRHVALGLYASGMYGTSDALRFYGGTYDISNVADDAAWYDSPLLGLMDNNRGKSTGRKMKHNLPVRVGVSVAWPLDDRWSLTGGMTFTRLSSSLHEGSREHYLTENQTLCYVGIPLGVSYRVASWKGLGVYLSSDVLTEKCVSGKRDRSYTLYNQKQEGEDIPLDDKPWQWSIGAKAGLQYQVAPQVALYAEPGLSYSFKDGSTLQTIYKDKPLNFSLNLGLRFMMGQ